MQYFIPAGRHFLSGLGSGVATAALLQPLDLMKTRVQQSGRTSIYEAWTHLRQSEHPVRALWRGTLPSTLRTGFGSAIYFTSLNAIRQHLSQLQAKNVSASSQSASTALPTLSPTANLLSGAGARTFAGFILMPLTVIKVRFESTLYSYPSLLAAARDIRRVEGFRGFFAGFGATAIRDAPYAGTYVLFYELIKSRLGAWVSSRDAQTKMGTSVASTINFTSAIFAGAACSVVSNPFDAVKTRIQLQPHRYKNIWQAWYRMLSEEGFRSLWSGLGIRMGRKALSSALAWTVYEELIRRYGGN